MEKRKLKDIVPNVKVTTGKILVEACKYVFDQCGECPLSLHDYFTGRCESEDCSAPWKCWREYLENQFKIRMIRELRK